MNDQTRIPLSRYYGQGSDTAVAEPATARDAPAPVEVTETPLRPQDADPNYPRFENPAPRTWWQRAGDAFDAATSFGGQGEVGWLSRRINDALNLNDRHQAATLGGTPQEREARRDAEMVARVQEERAVQGMRNSVDPDWVEGAPFLENLGRMSGTLVGDTAGNANPTYLIGGGGGPLTRMGVQGSVNAGIDAALQGSEMQEGIIDQFDPYRTGLQFVVGAGMQGALGEAPRALGDFFRGRTRGNPDVPADQLEVRSLEDVGYTPEQAALVESTGASLDQFSPDRVAAFADRVADARGRTPNVPRETILERSEVRDAIDAGEMDRSFDPGPLNPRVLPDGVTLTGTSQGNLRSDDPGAMIGLLRQLAADQNVIAQAQDRAANNPALRSILDSNTQDSQKAGVLWRILAEDAERARAETDRIDVSPELPPVRAPEAPPQTRSTVEAASGRSGELGDEQTVGGVLRGAGMSDNVVAGFLGNFREEGGYRGALGDGGTASGIAQWRGERRENFRKQYGKDPHEGTIQEQAEFVAWEMRNPEAAGMSKRQRDIIMRAESPEEAAKYIDQFYERSDGKARDKRIASARQIFDGGVPARTADESVIRAPAPTDDPLGGSGGGFERQSAQASPSRSEFERGEVFEQDEIFNAETGKQYSSPMGTGGNSRPFRDVPGADDRPEFRDDGPGTSFFEERNQRTQDEMVREYEASQSRRKERASSQKSQERDPSESYAKYGQRPFRENDDAAWRTTDDGMVADKNGNPVAFRSAKEAAKWATSNRMAGDFELASWGANTQRVVLKRRGNSTYGQSTPEPEAANASGSPSGETRNLPPPQTDSAGGGGSFSPIEPTREPLTGDVETVVTPSGREVETQFEVRELRDVASSDDPRFDKSRQPRDRGRASSDVQINEIAAKLDPEQLGSNRQAAHGSPIIGPDGMVEVGNGRTMAIKRAYANHPGRIAKYQKMIKAKGFDIGEFDQPILVRKRTMEIPPSEMKAWVNEAQSSGTMNYSAPERAKADAGQMSDDTLKLYQGGDVNAAANREFVKAWSQDTKADGNDLRASDGSLSPDGANRVRASILARAFDDSNLVGKLLGDTDNNIRAIGNALMDAAPKFAQVRNAVTDGRIDGDFDITKQVAEISQLISKARSDGTKISDELNQSDMFGKNVDATTESLARLMFKDAELTKPRSQVRLKEGLDFYLDGALKTEDGPGMFGDVLRPVDILEASRARLEAKDSAAEGQGKYYSYAGGKKKALSTQPKTLDRSLAQIAKGSDDPGYRELAEQLRDVMDEEVTVSVDADLRDGSGNRAAGIANPEARSIKVRTAGDQETILHEAIHMALMRKYGNEFSQLKVDDMGAGDAADLVRLFNDARDRFDSYGMFGKALTDFDTRYALSNVDEFISMAMTNRNFQNWLRRGTLWDRFVDNVRSLFGLPARLKPLLDDVLRSGSRLIESSADDPVRASSGIAPAARLIDKDGFKRDVKRVKEAIGKPSETLGLIGKQMKDVGAWAFFSTDARGRTIAERIKSDAVHEYMDNFFARPGMHDGKAVKRTYYESVQRYANARSQEAFRALDGIRGNKASEARVAEMLRFPKKRIKATEAEQEAAKELRRLFSDTIEYRKAAGEEIGEVTDGYLPRWLDVEQVMQRQDEFVAKAEKLYRGLGFKPDESRQQAQLWLQHIADTYAGVDGALDIRRATGDAVGSKTAQGRQFGKAADKMLQDFYLDDLMQVSAQYFHGAARRAEQTRRFGKKGAVGSAERKAWEKEHGDKTQLDVLEERMRADARTAGADGRDVMGVMQNIHQTNLGRTGSMTNGTRRAVAWAHTWTQLGVMDKAVVTSLAELAMGFVRGGPRYGFKFVRDSMKQYARQVRKADPDDATRWAEALGVVQDAVVNQALLARAGIEGGTNRSQKILAGFYEGTTLAQYTEGTRVASTTLARELLRQFSHDMTSKNARVSSRARKYLAEAGIRNPERFAKQVRNGGWDIKDVSNEISDDAMDYGTAVIRIANQTIMRPTRAEKPTWSAHPVGSMVFSLMSYSYGFKKQVLDRAGRLAVKGVKEKDATLLAPALGLAALTAWQAFNDTYIRPALFGGGPSEDETPIETGLRVADRAGLTGAVSPLINAFTGVRYNRSLSESLAGPVIGRPLDAGTKFVELAINNSPNTNTAERAAAGAVYDNMIEPVFDGVASLRLFGAARTGVIMGTGNRSGGVAPGDKDWFVDAVAGEKEEK